MAKKYKTRLDSQQAFTSFAAMTDCLDSQQVLHSLHI